LDHVRTRVRTPGQNGVRERGFQSLKYERLYREQIDDIHDLVAHSEDFRSGFNTTRPHEALSWNRPREVHLGLADPGTPNFPEAENLPEARHGTHADRGTLAQRVRELRAEGWTASPPRCWCWPGSSRPRWPRCTGPSSCTGTSAR